MDQVTDVLKCLIFCNNLFLQYCESFYVFSISLNCNKAKKNLFVTFLCFSTFFNM